MTRPTGDPADAVPDLLWLGPPEAPAVLLAHGAGADRTSPFLATVAAGFAAAGLRCARFDFPYMAARAHGRRPPPDPAPRLLAAFARAAAATGVPPSQLVLAGKSLGGRMATMLADDLGARGVVVFGYPFHPPDQPTRLRTAHLQNLRTPTLIVQGERDPFGTRAEVEGYQLAEAIALHWVEGGDHSLAKRQSAGRAQVLADAIAAAAAFVGHLPGL